MALGGFLCVWLGACSRGHEGAESRVGPLRAPSTFDPRTGTSASPRLAGPGDTIPKGGGTYKLGQPYKVSGRWYVPREEPNYHQTGVASWYGADFHGRKTANGEIYDMNALTAAHPTLPLPSYAYVTSLETGRTVLVRINDRGPYAHDRIIDLSRQTARALGSEGRGLAQVRVRYAGRAPLNGDDSRERQHLAAQPWWRDGGGAAVAASQQNSPNSNRMSTGLSAGPSSPSALPPVRQASDGVWSPLAHRAGRSGVGGP